LFHGVQAEHVWVIAGNMFRQGALVVLAPVLQPGDRSISGAKEQMTKTSLVVAPGTAVTAYWLPGIGPGCHGGGCPKSRQGVRRSRA
jgi:hypothetical protein